MPKTKVIMDVDTGVDDAFALLFAARCASIDLLAVGTVAGNVPLAHTLPNTLDVLALCGREDIPVAAGADGPLVRPLVPADDYHGKNGLNGVTLPHAASKPVGISACDQMIALSERYPGEIVLAPTGPLTNVALAIRKDAYFASRLKEIVLMGGAAFCPGNVGPCTEFNIGADPEAAKIVFSTGASITMVGLDVTDRTILPLSEIPVDESAVGDFARALLRAHTEAHGLSGMTMHDPLTLGYIADRTLLTTIPASIDIETAGELTCGMTVADRRAGAKTPNAMVAVEVDSARFNAFWIRTVFAK